MPSSALAKVKSSRASDTGYPRGHFGHLTAKEEDSLRSFKKLLEERSLYRSGASPSHEDHTLLRFLRARKWVPEDAYEQFKETEVWRQANNIGHLYEAIDLESYEECRRLYPLWTGRRDKRGIPLYLYEIRHLDANTIDAYEKGPSFIHGAKTGGKTPPNLLRLFALCENLTRFSQPLCSELTDREYPQTPITLSTNIVDVSGVSLKQFWNLKSHLQQASQLATAHYPETLDRIFIVGAPAFFGTVWGWIKKWLDPVTVAKVIIVPPGHVRSTLESFIDVQAFPKQYGGELDFAWDRPPNFEPTIREAASWENGHSTFPKGPMIWQPIDYGKRLECLAVGSINGKQRRERVCTIPRAYRPGDKASPTPVTPVIEAADDGGIRRKATGRTTGALANNGNEGRSASNVSTNSPTKTPARGLRNPSGPEKGMEMYKESGQAVIIR